MITKQFKEFVKFAGKGFYLRPSIVSKGRGIYCSKVCYVKDKTGAGNPNWRGGLSFEPYCPEWNPGLRRRIRAFFNYECLLCGKSTEKNGQQLSCHHVEYNKMACCDGKPVQFAALCRSCHTKTNFNRERWRTLIHAIIEEVYNNRSYFTKDEWRVLCEV